MELILTELTNTKCLLMLPCNVNDVLIAGLALVKTCQTGSYCGTPCTCSEQVTDEFQWWYVVALKRAVGLG